jgi:hypothetical protein
MKRRSAKRDHLTRIWKAVVGGAAITLGVVLVFAGLRELGLWFSLPASHCHGLCDWSTAPGPICPLIAIGLGGAFAGASLALLIERSGAAPDDDDHDRH